MATDPRSEQSGRTDTLVAARLGLARLVALVALIVLTSSLAGLPRAGSAQDDAGAVTVYAVPISGEIDLGLAPFLARVLREAEAAGAAAVILEIDTPGGRLDAVLQMRDALLDSRVRTIAFVDRTAFSAGALVAIAAEEIYMAPAGVLGAATPVEAGTGETASEKVVSAVRSTFRTTAELRGRDPRVAEAMVDPDVAIGGLVARGELLTLTTTEAARWGYADGVARDRAERLVRFVTSPIVASVLIVLALLLIVGDFVVEGFGVAGAVGLGLLATFFWGHLLAGLAGWEDVALVLLGLVLIAAEILVVPGFGLPGLLGLAALAGGLFLAVLGREIRTPEGTVRAALTVAASLVAVVVGLIAVIAVVPRTRRLRGLVLEADGEGSTARPPAPRWLAWFGGDATLPRVERPEDDR